MKNLFSTGDQKQYEKKVNAEDVASFHGEVVHAVCSTYVLAREIEWTTRLFVLEMRDDDEEGIGTFVHVNHYAPAFVGDVIKFTGKIDEINGHELICSVEARVGERLIASGKTGQKILKREKLNSLLSRK
jgi:fluoroacetyl-CoA thioesterase